LITKVDEFIIEAYLALGMAITSLTVILLPGNIGCCPGVKFDEEFELERFSI